MYLLCLHFGQIVYGGVEIGNPFNISSSSNSSTISIGASNSTLHLGHIYSTIFPLSGIGIVEKSNFIIKTQPF